MAGRAPTAFDVVVAGGGMVGASLAAALASIPLKVLVVEPFPPRSEGQPSYDDRATAVSEGSRRILEAIGCWDRVVSRAAPIRNIHVSERGRFGATRMRAGEHGLESFGHVVENRALGAALWGRLEACDAVELWTPARVDGLEEAGDAVFVSVSREGSKPKRIRARLLVAADGARSPLREMAGIGHETIDYGQTALIANVSPSVDHAGTAFERFTPDGPLAVLPLTEGRTTVVWTLSPEQAEKVSALGDEAFLAGLQAAFGYRLGRFVRVGGRAAYPLSLVQATAWSAGRVALAGNSAHGIHPVAGQGFNLGLRDAAALAELVASDPGGDPGRPGLLAEYGAWREGDRSATIRYTDGLVRLFINPLGPVKAARSLGLVGLDLLPRARSAVARRGMGLAGRLPRLCLGQPLS